VAGADFGTGSGFPGGFRLAMPIVNNLGKTPNNREEPRNCLGLRRKRRGGGWGVRMMAEKVASPEVVHRGTRFLGTKSVCKF
jgi:hypothetical protein